MARNAQTRKNAEANKGGVLFEMAEPGNRWGDYPPSSQNPPQTRLNRTERRGGAFPLPTPNDSPEATETACASLSPEPVDPTPDIPRPPEAVNHEGGNVSFTPLPVPSPAPDNPSQTPLDASPTPGVSTGKAALSECLKTPTHAPDGECPPARASPIRLADEVDFGKLPPAWDDGDDDPEPSSPDAAYRPRPLAPDDGGEPFNPDPAGGYFFNDALERECASLKALPLPVEATDEREKYRRQEVACAALREAATRIGPLAGNDADLVEQAVDVLRQAVVFHSIDKDWPNECERIIHEGMLAGIVKPPATPVPAAPDWKMPPIPPGFLAEWMAWGRDASPFPNEPLLLAGGLAVLACLASRRVYATSPAGEVRPVIYAVAIAESATGKDSCNHLIAGLLAAVNRDERLVTSIPSAAGLEDFLFDQTPVMLWASDEIGLYLNQTRGRNADANKKGVVDFLHTLFTRGGATIKRRPLSRAKKDKNDPMNERCLYPHLSIYGTSTPESFFRGLSDESSESGLYGRLAVFWAGSKRTLNEQVTASPSDPPPRLTEMARALVGDHLDTADSIPPLRCVEFTPEATEIFKRRRRDNEDGYFPRSTRRRNARARERRRYN